MTESSQLVFSSAGRHIIKAFSPQDADFHRGESVFLDRLHGRLPVATPRLFASGSWGGFLYVVMEQLDGIPLAEAWRDLPDAGRRSLLAQLGEAVRALHDLPVELFDAAPFRWRPLIEQQRRSVADNHRRWGLDEAWIAQIPRYLSESGLDSTGPPRLAPLHTELMPQHVFVRRSGAQCTLSGLIDFEPSMVGSVEYEFCAVGLFLTPGDKDLFRIFLRSYGYKDPDLTEELSRRIMALMLLHRYGNLNRFLKNVPAQERWTELRQAEQFWYGL
jgi:hygromycin-B 7''-O-kinase